MAFNFSPKIVTDGLVLYLDAANTKSYISGSTVWNDISRSGLNGTLTNGPTFSSANGGSIVFDGSNDYIDNIGDLSSFSFIQNTNIFSVSFWFKVDVINTEYRFIGNTITTAEKGFLVVFRYTSGFGFDALGCYVANGVGSTLISVGTTNDNIITDTNWHHACYVINNTTTGLWYIDGRSVTTTIRIPGTITVTNVKSTGDSTRTLNVGRVNSASPTNFLDGNIAQVQIYNRTLSASEVLQNYNATKTRFGL
jgi:hypothetical protein